METQIIYPKHPILKDLIQYFLFIDKKDFNEVTQVCYPNTNHCLSLMKESKIVKKDNFNFTILPSLTNSSYLTGIYIKPIKITVAFPYKELCINFNPLALGAIFNDNLSSVIFQNNILDDFNNIKWSEFFEIIFNNDSLQKKHNEIEFFFLSNLISKNLKNNYQQLLLNKINYTNKVDDLSNNIYKSYRSTHRFFKNGLQLSPKEFLHIKKVREGMNMLLENKKITEIAYDLGFTDQSHFIKVFKKFTNLTPLQFRKNATQVDNTLIWKIE